MRNMGNQQFNHDSFRLMYDQDPKISSIVKDFDNNSITLKTHELDDLEKSNPVSKNTVSQMAKRATKLG